MFYIVFSSGFPELLLFIYFKSSHNYSLMNSLTIYLLQNKAEIIFQGSKFTTLYFILYFFKIHVMCLHFLIYRSYP